MKFDLMEFSSRVTRSLGSVAIWQHWRSVFFDAVRSVGDNQTKVDEREGEVRVCFLTRMLRNNEKLEERWAIFEGALFSVWD